MAYVERDGNGDIIIACSRPQYGDQEYVDEKDQEYVDYVSAMDAKRQGDLDRDVKIDLKMRIDAGTALSLNMSAEQAELDVLMGE